MCRHSLDSLSSPCRGGRSLPCGTSSIAKWFYREHRTARSGHISVRLPNRKACKGRPGIRSASRSGSLQVSVIGWNNRGSLYVRSAPIISRGIYVIALAGADLARVMLQRSGTS